MSEITDPQVIAFSNNKIRPLADHIYQAYFGAKQIILDYNSDGIGALISAAGASNLIADGSAIDGRTRITGDDFLNFITATQAFVAYVEGGAVATADRTTVITKPHVNGL